MTAPPPPPSPPPAPAPGRNAGGDARGASAHDAAAPAGPGRWNLAAAFLTWVLPGLGHLLIGHRERGLILGCAILTLWVGGLLIGGVSIVDRRDNPFFFVVGQMWVAPSFVVDTVHARQRAAWLRQREFGEPDARPADDGRLYRPAFGKPAEVGALYVTVAGLLNVLAMIDVVYRTRR